MNSDSIYLALAVLVGLMIGIGMAWLYSLRASSRQTQLLNEAEQRLRVAVQDMASSALRDNTDMFLKLANESFGKTVAQVGAADRERREAFATLRSQLESITQGQSTLQRETRNLVTALRRPEVRGRWGEITLRRVVEIAGMSEHCDFTEQAVLGAAAVRGGEALRPDLLVHLPEGRTLVVDAKAPLDAYLSAIEAQSDEQRSAALLRHAQQVEARVRDLASKAYWALLPQSPEFAVLFLPGDQFLSAALSQRPDLLDNALQSNVIIATPSTLMALLKVVAYGWRQAAVTENAQQIQQQGQELYRRLSVLAGHLARSSRALRSTVEAHNSTVGSLERQLLPAARRFAELGAFEGEPLADADPLIDPVRDPTPPPGSA